MPSDIDPRNRLNELTNREFMRETKSFWLSNAPPRDRLKLQHPATFSERDIERLIRLFTKAGDTVLDPFLGSGSTLVACRSTGRHGRGIELVPQWADLARERLGQAPTSEEAACEVVTGDAEVELDKLPPQSVQFVVTSPPYWSILNKPAGMKVRAERTGRGLPTSYSEDPADLGNIPDYDVFVGRVANILGKCRRVLAPERYMAVIVSDFRHGPRFYLYHADLARALEERGLALKAITILAQDNKKLYPFGVPSNFVSNIHHQYILILRS